MQPRTKIQKKINDLFLASPKLTSDHYTWAEENLIKNKSIRLKTGKISCLRCGHEWFDKTPLLTIIDINCPGCDRVTKVEDSRNKNFGDSFYWNIVTVEKGYQIVKTIRTRCNYKRGTAASIWHTKIGETWWNYIDPVMNFGQYEPSSYREQWAGGYELRNSNNIAAYCLRSAGVYPKIKVLPIFKRNGFKGKFHNLRPVAVLDNIVTDTMSETLIKAKQFALLYERNERSHKVSKYWSAIKICMRNKYIVKDGKSYLDYLDLLVKFKKDVKNPEFVCPKDFHAAHQVYVKKQQAIDDAIMERRNRERQIEAEAREQRDKLKILKNSLKYKRRITPYANLNFVDGDISIVPLLTVQQFKDEGQMLVHCIYTNAYYKEENSLLFSARVKGVVTETVEVSLKDFEIKQARGFNNLPTKFNNAIKNIVNKNMIHIKKIAKSIEKTKKHSLENSDRINAEAHAA